MIIFYLNDHEGFYKYLKLLKKNKFLDTIWITFVYLINFIENFIKLMVLNKHGNNKNKC
jgi:hypothetical protein